MQRMIMIPEERYDKMLENYDSVMNELEEIRDQLRGDKSGTRQRLNQLLDQMDEKQLEGLYYLVKGMTGDVI